MIDIVFAAKGRPEFTRESLKALAANTDWPLVRKLVFYTDGSKEFDVLSDVDVPVEVYHPMVLCTSPVGGPVNIMIHYLERDPSQVWAKIDNDVIVPPGWLARAGHVMDMCPELSFLGLEPPLSRTPAPWSGGKRIPTPEFGPEHHGRLSVEALHRAGILRDPVEPIYAKCDAIGGVGLMRTEAFAGHDMKQHSTYGGFTDWQLRRKDLVKGWIVPPINLFLLDRLPFEPWASLSKQYIAAGVQRSWTNYDETSSKLWEWWLNARDHS
jgi:hypothetical protein